MPTGSPPWAKRPRASRPPTPPPRGPSWSMPMPADPQEQLDLRTPQRIHIVGIGGAGMSAIALVLRDMGHHVSGSDLKDSPVAERLRLHRTTVAAGHGSENVAGADTVTSSPAVQPDNPELVEARVRGMRVVPR